MADKQPDALRLADELTHHYSEKPMCSAMFAAAELRRQHALIAELVGALEGMQSCWTSVCLSRGWHPEHVIEATMARAALAKAKEAQ